MNHQSIKARHIALGLFAAIATTPLLLGNLPASAKPMSSGSNPQPTTAPATSQQKTNNSSTTGKQSAASHKQASNSSTASKQASMLKIGSQGKLVSQVQSYLKQQKLYKGAADGNYGAATAKAVSAFQKSKNIKADGVVGSKTLAAMNL